MNLSLVLDPCGDFYGAGFSLRGLVLAMAKPHRLKPAPLEACNPRACGIKPLSSRE